MSVSETTSKADSSLALGSGQIMCSLHFERSTLIVRMFPATVISTFFI